MRLLPVGRRRRPVGGRADQRMPEPNPGAELRQAPLRRGRCRLAADPEPPGGPPYQRRVPGRVGRRHQQQPPGLLRQGVDLPPEAVLDPPRQRQPAARPATYSSSADLPPPATPRTTSTRLCPARTASTSRSSTPHSATRSVSPPPTCGPGTMAIHPALRGARAAERSTARHWPRPARFSAGVNVQTASQLEAALDVCRQTNPSGTASKPRRPGREHHRPFCQEIFDPD